MFYGQISSQKPCFSSQFIRGHSLPLLFFFYLGVNMMGINQNLWQSVVISKLSLVNFDPLIVLDLLAWLHFHLLSYSSSQ